jgi:hypothetical protein
VRVLLQKHGLPPGLPEDGVEKAAIELLGGESGLHDWFQRAVHSTRELQLDEALAGVGLKGLQHAASGADDKGSAEENPAEATDPASPARGWLGATLREKGAALEEVAIQLAQAPRDTVTIVPDKAAAGEVIALREKWLDARWPDPGNNQPCSTA